MPTLEPIVNQEEKELQVPTFNKKEVEGIAKEVAEKVVEESGGGGGSSQLTELDLTSYNFDTEGPTEISDATIVSQLNNALSEKKPIILLTKVNGTNFGGVATTLYWSGTQVGYFECTTQDYGVRIRLDSEDSKWYGQGMYFGG